MVTTKSGANAKKGLGVSYSAHVSMDNVMRWPDYQYEFGQGQSQKHRCGRYGIRRTTLLFIRCRSGRDPSTGGTQQRIRSAFRRTDVLSILSGEPRPCRCCDSLGGLQRQPERPVSNRLYTDQFRSIDRKIRPGQPEPLSHIPKTNGYCPYRLSTYRPWYRQPNKSHVLYVSTSKRAILIVKSTTLPHWDTTVIPLPTSLIFQNPNVNLDWLRPMWKKGQEGLEQLQPYSSYIGNPFVTLYEAENPSEKHNVVSTVSANLKLSSKFDFMIRSGIQPLGRPTRTASPHQRRGIPQRVL